MFESKAHGAKAITIEAGKFVGSRIFTGIMSKLSGRSWGFPNSDKSYSVNYSNEGGPHYEFKEQIGFKRDPNDDEETYKRKRDEFFKNNTRVLIKTEPIE